MASPKDRDQDYIYGARSVMEALESGRQIDKILVKKGLDSDLRNDVTQLARQNGIPVQVVPSDTLDRLTRGGNHQGVLAFSAVVRYADLEQTLLGVQASGQVPLFLMLDQVSDVRNFGAIARTAECMGVHAVIIPEQGAARINAEAMKVSAGALNHLPICRVIHLQDAVNLLHAYNLIVVACTEKASETIFDCPLAKPLCLVLGSEESGISPRILRSADHLARIPMQGKVASLNVSVSAGMALLETMRQRQPNPAAE